MEESFPLDIFSGVWDTGHCQGIALDTAHNYVYYSFTTAVVKTDLKGNVIGTVTGLLGHLGCIDFNDEDGRLYGSLEYKSDAIGQGILAHLGHKEAVQDAFYVAVFDADRINRIGMDACTDGIMKTVYLRDVVDDYHATVLNGGRKVAHRWGCSGIDGTTFGPLPGTRGGRQYLYVAYGVYSDLERTDNDCQVILCYDTSDWDSLMQPLSQKNMHTSGPAAPAHRFFVYTGNTTYGVQNLEYDAYTGSFLMAVYSGKKPRFPNKRMYIIDGGKAPELKPIPGAEPPQEGEMLTLLPSPAGGETPGWDFEHGSTGLYSFGDGRYCVSCHEKTEDGRHCTHVRLARWNGRDPLEFVQR